MTFTYLGDLSTDLDQIRFYIQDTVSGSGPKPSGGNFTDEEITPLLSIAGTVNRTVAALFNTLASVWSQYNDVRAGPRDEKLSQIAEQYRKRAKEWRAEHHIMPGVKPAPIIRVDGYSDDITSDDVITDSEYGRPLRWLETTD